MAKFGCPTGACFTSFVNLAYPGKIHCGIARSSARFIKVRKLGVHHEGQWYSKWLGAFTIQPSPLMTIMYSNTMGITMETPGMIRFS